MRGGEGGWGGSFRPITGGATGDSWTSGLQRSGSFLFCVFCAFLRLFPLLYFFAATSFLVKVSWYGSESDDGGVG